MSSAKSNYEKIVEETTRKAMKEAYIPKDKKAIEMKVRFDSITAENYELERMLELVYANIKEANGSNPELFSHVIENEKHYIIIRWEDAEC